ncbi:MAG TPA: tRNA pseudouridine(38-40) synthase TruA, partial [Candidatus Merdenecus merdavium]|nr:tRNA pseudouridine(38-40) synthase TruA [Candidatus Merdenecus merdavium]
GWQRLGKNESTNTIENKIIEVLTKMTGEDIQLFCGSRTEVGVHAYEQVVNFKTNTALKPYEIKHYLNRYLPMDIAILDVTDMPERFHASLNAISRTYLYRISVGDSPSVFDHKYTYYCFGVLDLDAMKKGAEYLVGTHDFKNFSTVKRSKSTVKTLYKVEIYGDEKEVQITMQGTDFLHNMARMISATLMEIGLKRKDPKFIEEVLKDDSTTLACAPADAQGLFLQEIEY